MEEPRLTGCDPGAVEVNCVERGTNERAQSEPRLATRHAVEWISIAGSGGHQPVSKLAIELSRARSSRDCPPHVRFYPKIMKNLALDLQEISPEWISRVRCAGYSVVNLCRITCPGSAR